MWPGLNAGSELLIFNQSYFIFGTPLRGAHESYEDEEAKRNKVEAKLLGNSPQDIKFQRSIEDMEELGLDRTVVEKWNQVQDKGADEAMKSLAQPRITHEMQPKILHLVKHDRDHRYTILMEPLLLYLDKMDLKRRLKLLHSQPQWQPLVKDAHSECVFTTWLIRQRDNVSFCTLRATW